MTDFSNVRDKEIRDIAGYLTKDTSQSKTEQKLNKTMLLFADGHLHTH